MPAYGTVNADVIQTSTTGGILGAGNASIMKNRLINGSCVIDQRNAGASVATTTVGSIAYSLDRWNYLVSQASKFTIQQNAGSVTPPVGFSNYLGITSTSAYSIASGDYFLKNQFIEGFNTADLGWGTANAKAITLSFWVQSSLTGTFGGALQNSASNRSYPFSYTISVANTWEYKTISIAGDTTGTWLTTNGTGLKLSFGLGVGTTFSGTAGAWAAGSFVSTTGATSVVGTNGATFYITGVQLEVGSSATGFEYVNYQTSLANCQRYYYKVSTGSASGYFSTGGQWYGSTSGAITTPFPVPMRTKPTALEQSGTTGHYNLITPAGGAVGSNAVPTFQVDTTIYLAVTNFSTASGGTAGYTTNMYSANAAAYLAWSAEL